MKRKERGEGLTNKYVLYLDADVPSRICIDACQPENTAPQFSVYVTSLSLLLSLCMCVYDMHMSIWICVC